MDSGNNQEDYVSFKGFLDKNELLEYLEEDEIFSLVLGYIPKEYQHICNPLRIDNLPGAYFEVNPFTDRLELIDWGYTPHHIDSFLFVQRFYGLPNFYQTLVFIHDNLLINKQELKKIDVAEKKKRIAEEKEKFKIFFRAREFHNSIDAPIWQKYGIAPSHLNEDAVFAVTEYAFQNAKKNGPFNALTPTYVFTEFAEGHKKMYFPYKKEGKYITDCVSDDIGGLHYFDKTMKKCLITKGYKDYRVCRNVGLNNFWLQSESMFPNDILLASLLENMEEVIVFFDNDEVGIKQSKLLADHINTMFGDNRARPYHLPIALREFDVKDTSDYRAYLGSDQVFSNFMLENVCK